jgi:hypothetical protein
VPGLTLKQARSLRRNKRKSIPPPQPEIEMCTQMSNSSEAMSERRQTPRTKLSEIAYIGMGPENGGLVLDVSDGGLSFHSVAPVQPSDTIRFLLSIEGQTRIEGSGEVVWTNEMRTVCGLKFIALSGDAREFLNHWTIKSPKPVGTSENPSPPVSTVAPESEGPLPNFTSPSDANTPPLFAIAPLNETGSSEAPGRSIWREPIFSWIAFGFLAAALTVTAYNYGVHVGKSQAGSVAQAVSNPTPQKETQVPPPAPDSAPAVASETPSVPNIQSSAPSLDISAGKGGLVNTSKTIDATDSSLQSHAVNAPNAPAPAAHSEQASEAGHSQLAAALAYLNGENGPRDASKAAKQLWAAVGNGNSDAEVILAGLYAKGDGVAKNCEQARVLLKAAMKSGNAQAKAKLAELNAHGCS